MKILFTLFFVALCLCGAAHGAIIYVDKDAACNGSGTTGSPYCSIQLAFNNVAAGDTIRIRDSAAPYDEAALLLTSGTVNSRITIEPDVGHNPRIYRTGSGGSAAIELRKVSYVTIQNLNFDATGINTTNYGVWVHASLSDKDGADMLETRIIGNTFTNWGGSAAHATTGGARGALIIDGGFCNPCPGSPRNTLVQDNTFTGNRQASIMMLHANDTIIENNTITGAKCGRDSDTSTNTMGIKLIDAVHAGSTGTIIRDNVISDFEAKADCGIAHVGGAYDSLPAIWCDVGPINGIVERNHIYNINPPLDSDRSTFESQGVFIEHHCSGWIVRNNVIYNIGGAGIRQRMATTAFDANHYLNNTIYSIGGNGLEVADGMTVIKNNVIMNAAIQIAFDTAQPGLHDIDYNLYYWNTGGNKAGAWGLGPVSFSSWKSSCGCDANAINADPLFVAAGSNNHLSSGSPAINTGVTVAEVTNDFDETPRPQGPAFEMGAYEFIQEGGGTRRRLSAVTDLTGQIAALTPGSARASIGWTDPNTAADQSEDGTIVNREIAGTYQQVGTVGANVTTFSQSFPATEGAQLCYKVKPFYHNELPEEAAPLSNEWCGKVPACKQKGKSGNCR